jgi:hypothetical protein
MPLRSFFWQTVRLISIVICVTALGARCSYADTPNYAPIQKILAAPGVIEPDGVLHFDLVRSDLSITVGSQAVNSAEVGNGYVNFKYMGNSVWYVDGSLPAQESELAALQAALRTYQTLHITAVVNQVVLESPRLVWVHFESENENGSTLAYEISSGLQQIENPQKGVTSVPIPLSVIPGALFQDAFLGANGTITQLNGAVYVFTVPRDDINHFFLGGVPASASLGVAYTFYVQPLSTGNNIVLNTDLGLKQPELQPVRDALAAAGLTVGSVHDNFVDDSSRLFFVNGYAVGDAGVLGDSLYNSLTAILNQWD